jgi:peptide-methionine (R)-S-oxide reductase
MSERSIMDGTEWKRVLTPEQFAVTQRRMTEPAWSGRYCDFHGVGVYRCVCCGNALFSSEAKFGGRSKWPTFAEPVAAENVRINTDDPYYPVRSEVLCAHCAAHLGFVLDVGRPKVGLRYVINSCALTFVGGRGRAEHACGVPSTGKTGGEPGQGVAVP